ncbi:MAG: KTSC domain-containing protein [candidate division WOR-3 bacterium]|nr:KTSC domain-containing protein [candidate division WOR-3 bacterium]
MTGFGKRPSTIPPLLLSLALLVAATTLGCGKKQPPAPQPAGTSTTPVQTGAVGSVAYDEGRRTLLVTLDGGTTFEYTDVPREVYVGIMAAPERGAYFSANIRNRYPYRLITSVPPGLIGNRGHAPKPEKPPKSSRGRGRGR